MDVLKDQGSAEEGALKLKKVSELPGVLGAATFTDKGELANYRGQISQSHAQMAAHMCAANSTMVQMQSRLFGDYAQDPAWKSNKGWTMLGPELGVIVVGDTMCFLNRKEASLNQIFSALED